MHPGLTEIAGNWQKPPLTACLFLATFLMCYSSDSLEQSFFLLVRRVKRTRHTNDHTRFAACALYALSLLTLKKKRGCWQSTPFWIAKYRDDTKHGSKSGVSRIIRESWQHNLVPRVLPYPPYGARDRERVSLSLSLCREGRRETLGMRLLTALPVLPYKRWQSQPTTSAFTSLKHSRRPCAPLTAK